MQSRSNNRRRGFWRTLGRMIKDFFKAALDVVD